MKRKFMQILPCFILKSLNSAYLKAANMYVRNKTGENYEKN